MAVNPIVIASTIVGLILLMKYDISLDIFDVHPGNFMIDKEQNIYLVDEGGLMHTMKGFSFGRLFQSWLNPEQRKVFWQGYAEKHRGDYFDTDYEALTRLEEAVRAVSFRASRNYLLEKYQTELNELKNICNL